MKNSITALSSAVDLEFGDWFLLLGPPNKIQILPVRDMDRFHGKKKKILEAVAQNKAQ